MEQFKLDTRPLATPEAIIQHHNARFTVLTPHLIRIEYSEQQQFEDRASQVFWYRKQPVPDFHVEKGGGKLEIRTDALKLTYVGTGEFTENNLSIELLNSDVQWFWGKENKENLQGTARTLDNVSGFTVLGQGLISRDGWTLIDDRYSLVFDDRDWLVPRAVNQADAYFFGYGKDYQRCLNDYFVVAGHIPLIPRWVLGNWWSRYWEYTQEELTQLMLDFKTHDVPLSVCIVDMDWHITDTGNESNGWTGYTWNRELFPDPAGFMAFLHEEGLKTALNLHPASGIYPHEAQYSDFAQFMDVKSGDPIPFQIGDPRFAQGYFEILHHPLEAEGVDFWWLDWQQGTESGVERLDPLWWLNHLHFYDLGRNNGKRPFIFSRWGGLGNHRYPIGFSGDTLVNWESLAFQPYFTATAANVGYGWWSHDIGGHMGGIEDSELYVRWVQFGVFSPIFRLHSTKNRFHERLPWGYDAEIYRISSDYMRLRHALIPYLYSMVWQTTLKGCQLVRPMYHDFPEHEQAYHCHNQYTFGSEMIVAPVLSPIHEAIGLGRQVIWFPEHDGGWFNLFKGDFYASDTWHPIYSKLDEIPVFAKAGAVVPMTDDAVWSNTGNPQSLVFHLFPNAGGSFTLYEDAGMPSGEHQSERRIESAWRGTGWDVTLHPTKGPLDHLPESRNLTFAFKSVVEPDEVKILVDDAHYEAETVYDADEHTFHVVLKNINHTARVDVQLNSQKSLAFVSDTRALTVEKLIQHFRMNSWAKADVYKQLPLMLEDVETYEKIGALLNDAQRRALLEVLLEAGIEHITNIDERRRPVILWNNGSQSEVTRRYTWWHGWRGAHIESGTAPRFEVFEREYEWHRQIVELSYRNWHSVTTELSHQ